MVATYVAMWSGPRNVSTALMRSFGSRSDTVVVDEPLYAFYLRETGLEHPGREEILARHEAEWERVVEALTAPLPAGRSVAYQKHMAHHLLPGVDTGWLAGFRQAFLIREPRAMIASLDKVLAWTPRLEDTGLPQQVRLFEELERRTGEAPPVVEARDLLADPPGILAALCARLGLEFEPAMLSWEPGPRETDGCWGPRWYANTWQSTGFAPPRDERSELRSELEPLLEAALPLYETLRAHRLGA